MVRLMLAGAGLFLLTASTLVYITGNANSIADSGNHSGTLNVPQPNTTRAGPLSRPMAP